MTTSVNYPTPVFVNGFQCKNCTEVDEAKKHIDPAHPKDGPYGIYAKDNPSTTHGPAVTLGGALAGLAQTPSAAASAAAPNSPNAAGQRLNALV